MNYKHILSASVLMASVVTAESRTFNFDEAEGFKAGPLHGQNGWVSEKNIINLQGDGFIELAGEPWRAGYYSEAIPAKSAPTFTLSAVFSFSEAQAGGNNDVVSFLFNNKTSSKGTARCFISRASDGGYKIGFKGTQDAVNDSKAFPKELLGFTDNNLNSAPLKITFSLTKGTSSNDWNLELQLVNLETGKRAASLSKSGVETSQELFDATDVYGGFSSSRPENVSGTTNRRIYSIEIHDIPTEETLSLLLS